MGELGIPKEKNKKVNLDRVFTNIFRILLVFAIGGNLTEGNWLNMFTAITTLALTFLPYLISQKNHIYLPRSFQTVIFLFIFAALYLGNLRDFYTIFWWWDLMLHTLSGVILGFIGFLLIYLLNKDVKVNVMLSPFFVVLFSATFAVTMGVLWEVYEFSMDSIFALNMQKSGLVDTMWDLIVDTIGAVFSSIIGYLYLKNQQIPIFGKFVRKFYQNALDAIKNPKD